MDTTPSFHSTRRNIFYLSRSIICLIVCASMGSLFIPISGKVLRFLDIAIRTYLIFVGTVMAHESVHGHLANTRSGNYWWGRIALLPSMVPFTNFRRTHQLHHAFTNIPDKDPDHFMKSRNLFELALRAIAMPHHWFFWLRKRGRIQRADLLELGLNYLAIFVVHGLILSFIGPVRFFWGVVLPLILVSFLLWYPFAVQTHEGFSTGSPESRSHNYYGYFMFWFSLGLSMHREHHLKPKLAWLQLLPFVETPDVRSVWPRRDIRFDTPKRMSAVPGTTVTLTTLDYILSVMDTPKSPVDFAIVFHFNDQLDLDALRVGAESARRMFPTSGSLLRRNRWVQERETSKGSMTTAICSDAASAIHNFINRRLDPQTDFPVQQLAVTSSNGSRSTVVTRFHHAVADGMSAALWLTHQFEIVCGVRQPSQSESPCEQPVLKMVENQVRKSRYAFAGASDRLATSSDTRSGVRSWVTIEIDACSLRKLIRRTGGFTYSDLLSTWALEVYARWNQLRGGHDSQRIGLWLPVNVRRRPGEGFGNGTSRIRIYDRSPRTTSLTEKCLEVRRQIEWCTRHGEWAVPQIKGLSLLPRTLTGPFLRRNLTRRSLDMATGVFSHADRWNSSDSKAFDSVDKLECVGLLHPLHALAINGATHKGKTWLTFTYDTGLLTRTDVLRLTGLYQEQIELAREQLR